MPSLVELVRWVVEILTWLIIADVIISYIPSIPPSHPAVVMLRKITHLILNPIRKIIPPVRIGDGYVDFSPIIAIFALSILSRILR